MRSIHKKTLKRFLSTLLAVVMVLGMVPFTALAAPADVTLTQSGLKATITPSVPAVTAGNTSTVTYAVTIEATAATASGKNVSLTIGPLEHYMSYAFGTVTITGSAITGTVGMPAGLALSGGKITGTVTGGGYAIGSHTVPMSLTVSDLGTDTDSTTFTVDQKAALTVTAAPSTVTAGEDFTVTATSDIAEGYVKFTYGADDQRVAVIPDENGEGIASATFTATGTAGTQDVTALQYAMTGVVNTEATTTITVGAADTYYDVTFLPGAADAYIPFSPTTVSVKSGESYTLPTAIPTRPGYVFAGWDRNNDGVADIEAAAAATGTVSGNMTLNALWKRQAVTVSLTASDTDVTPWLISGAAGKVGDTVRFNVTIPAKYNTADVLVCAGNSVLKYLSPVAQYYDTSTGKTTLYYEFEITEDLPKLDGGTYKLPITVDTLPLNQYTVMMPVGHFDAAITAVKKADGTNASGWTAASASVEYGGSYTFTVTPASGYEIKGVYVNGVAQTAASVTGATRTYTVTNVTSAQTVEVLVDEIPSYTVTFTVPLTGQTFTQTVTRGGNATRPVVNPEREGYTFGGWFEGSNYSAGTAQFNFTTPIDDDTILYGKLNPATYNITYDANGGSGAPAAQSKTHGLAITLQAGVPTRTGYTFLGWGTSATATAASYQPGDAYSGDANITLYAVWQINTFTVTLPNGTGYSISTTQSTTVEYDKNFTFTVTVDPGYAVTAPTVKVNDDPALTNPTPTTNADGSKTYTYTISNIQENKVVSVSVTKNSVYTVTFMVNGSVYQTQQVEHNAKATVPNPPSVEGYTFGGWYKSTDFIDANEFDFTAGITGDTTVYGKMTAITPEVTYPDSGTGWALDVTTPAGLASGGTVTYKSDVKFTVTIAAGYDATNLAVAANGLALAPVEVNGNTYKFVLSNITADQNITVTGVVRKMITITYNDNGGIGGPGQEQVPMYVAPSGIGDEGNITSATPSRVGYTFAKWNTKADGTGTEYAAGANNTFTTDTTLYAVWSAKTTTVTLTVDKTSQYEGENVVLTAEVKSGTTTAVTSGSVQFYRSNNGVTPELVGTAKVSGGKAVLTIATSAYKRGEANTDSYTVKFVPDEGSGYSKADTTADPDVVNVLSTAISWKLNTSSEVDTKANVLTIKDSSDTEVDSMTAGQEYTLELPAIYALDATTYSDATKLVVNKDYKVTWQFCNASGTWEDYTAAAGTNSVKILAEYSQYVFRAVVTPLTGATGHFTKAAVYTDTGALTPDSYVESLVTKATNPVAQQETATTLAVTDTHNLTSGTAEFEGQKVTLTATVTLSGSSTTKVTTGEVYFYKVGSSDTLIGKANVQSDGTAVLEATMSTYSAGASDVFKAVYQENATYNTSTSNPGVEVVIRSTAIAWASSKALTVMDATNANPVGSIIAGTTYTLNLPAVVEDGQSGVSMTVGTDYTVEWYEEAPDGTITKIGATETNTFTVTPATEKVQYYAQVLPKTGSNYTDAYQDGYKNFLTSDKTNESVKAATTTTITFGDVKTDTGKTPDFSQYEEKTITITAQVMNGTKVVPSGTVTFYVVTAEGTNKEIGTAAVDNSGQATVSYTLPAYALSDGLSNIEYFFAMYTDTVGTYADSNTTTESSSSITAPLTHYFGVGTDTKIDKETEAVQILSTSISWKLDGTNKIVASPDANKLTIYVGNGTSGTVVDTMTAGSTYTLELPAVYALDDAQNATNPLAVNKDYKVTWQYRETDVADWQDYTSQTGGDTVLITPDYSGYQFQAVVTPIYDNAALTGYKTAAQYDNTDKVNGKTSSLVTDPTEKTELQKTTTTLAITGADNELASTKFNGQTLFGFDHLAQFEGQKVTLEATVTDNATSTGVTVGYVNFYRYVESDTDVLLNTTPVKVGANGVATFEVTISDYSTASGQTALTNVDRFYAVYLVNDTYDTSASVTDSGATPPVYNQPGDEDSVWVKSTAIKTPVIDSTLFGKRGSVDNATSTSYTEDLTDLLAGVEHTFTLRTGASTADYSVVALDGRTVDAENYDIQWNVKTGDNTVTDATVGGTFTTSNNKVGDEISVTLIAKNDMKVDATSKKAIIGTKQDVNVTVTASDEIASTTDTDVYQLNPIILTATVAAKETDATVKPSGTVAFYYSVNGTAWTKVGETTDLAEVAGVITASITTDKLPVAATTNTKQNVTITAIYSGDETFKNSGTIDTDGAITDTAGCTVTDETVTVYSSVVYVNSGVENVARNTVGQDHTSGIYIYAEEDKVLANETNVNLKLSDVYTLDHNIDLSKLAYGVDYTVQWQKLSNAASYASDYADKEVPWQPITSANGTICQITVEQGAAYRAVITVNNTPIAKGSYTFVDQGTVGTADIKDGRQVYYSNILVAADAPATVTVNVNTDKTGAGFEGIVEGETVTIHTFASGASGTTPISELTVTITDANRDVVNEQVKTNVNGHVSFDWTAAKPGYYELKVVAKFTNGYSDKTITRTLIVRDNDYGFTAAGDNTTYNGKVQGLTVSVEDMGIESALAQKSVVVYYYDKDGKQVEPTQAGTYKAVIRLQESAYWTEKTMDTTFTIKQREVSVVDLIAQAKVYDGTTNANIQEIILNDAETAQTTTGLPTGTTGIINGDSVYAVGTGYTAAATAGATTLGVKEVELKGDDAANYKLVDATYTEAFNIQRSQVKGDIANSTYKYTGSNITVPADDIYLIDQAGNEITSANYTVTYYYHNGDGVEKVTAMNKLGKYTVIARPEQTNYKGGASQTVYVAATADDQAPDTTAKSALIDITNTVKLFDGTATGVTVTATKGNVTSVTYNGSTTVPSAAGRYLVKVTTDTNDTAYGIYTIVKARPALELSATGAEYTSAQISGTPTGTFNGAAFPTGTYFTYAGGTIQGVAYEAPTEVGTYIVTAHVPETENYTAHEISAQFVIAPKALTITADSLQRHQYSAYPDMTASFDGLATEGVAADTSLRDVQIQPELVFDARYTNDASDQVGNYSVTPVAALARNYAVSYVSGNISVTAVNPNPELAIHGMIDNGTTTENIAYYGDKIQLYAYGSQMGSVINNSSVLTWSVTNPSICGTASISQDGLLEVNGVGTFTVTLTRGVGAQKISTSITITALKQEVKVVVPELNTVYKATPQDYTTTNTMIAVNAKGEQVFTGKDRFVINGNTRTDVGSQIVTGKVVEGVYTFQSETYGGLFTINDKEVTVKPTAQTVTYGTDLSIAETAFTVDGKVGSVEPLTNTNVASVRELYNNLDVGTYEILVAGTENQNYNVKYETNPVANKVTVEALALDVSTGTLDANVGMTSGSLNPLGNYPANGAEVASTAALGAANVRMYGEPNWVMDYALTSLIPGDSLADLALDPLAGNLVDFNYTIAANANVKYEDKTTKIESSMTDYNVDTDASMIAFGNYTESYTEGTQNIYQRPVTLALSNGQTTLDIYYSEILTSGGTIDRAKLLNIIINNVEAGKYNDGTNYVGGLAELLKHTVKDLNLKVTTTGYTGSTNTQFTATVTVGNPNYWLGNAGQKFDITVNILLQRLTVDYTTFTATFSDVVLYQQSETTRVAAYATGDVTFIIYRYVDGQENYSYYAANETAVVSKVMTKDTSRTGRYYVTYPKLSAGTYRVFAVASGYTIID